MYHISCMGADWCIDRNKRGVGVGSRELELEIRLMLSRELSSTVFLAIGPPGVQWGHLGSGKVGLRLQVQTHCSGQLWGIHNSLTFSLLNHDVRLLSFHQHRGNLGPKFTPGRHYYRTSAYTSDRRIILLATIPDRPPRRPVPRPHPVAVFP